MSVTIVPNLGDLAPVKKEAYLDGWVPSQMPNLSFVRQTMSRRPLSVTGLLAAPDYVAHTEGQQVNTQSLEKGYTETFDYESWEFGMAISSRVQREIDAAALAGYYRSAAGAGIRRLLKSIFAILNNAVDGSYLKGDGKTWAATDHPSNVGVQSNAGSSALDNTAFEAAVRALRELLGPDGQLESHDAALLYVPPALDGTAYQILGSEFSAADDRRAINISRTRNVSYDSTPFLSAAYGGSDTRWHLFSVQAMQRGICRVNVFEPPAPRIERIEGTKKDLRLIDQMDMETGTVGWRGYYSSSS